ncbi:MAG: ribonuclease R [Pseudomonadota bacterium]
MSRLPSDDEILSFLRDNPGQSGKREIARAFGVKGAARITLKQQLKSLRDRGLIVKEGAHLQRTDELPSVFPATIVSVDDEGDLLVQPKLDREAYTGLRFVLKEKRGGRRSAGSQTPPGVGDMVLVRKLSEPDADEPGTVQLIKVIGKPKGRHFGVLRRPSKGVAFLEPVDRKSEVLTVPEHLIGDAQAGDLVAATRLAGARRHNPQAQVDEVFGQLGTERAISQIAILRNDLPDAFPAEVIAEVEGLEPATQGTREDWRKLPLITIDPADAKDHDDAVHAALDDDPSNEGGYVITVAIADVAYYVRPHTALDREARTRGNSVYFPDRVIPMLPEKLSTDLCSLHEGEDRPALAIRIVIDRHGRKLRHSLHRVWIRLHAGLAYEAAQAAIDGGEPAEGIEPCPPSFIEPVLKPLWAAYRALSVARDKRSPLALDLPERKLVLNEAGEVSRVRVPERLDAHRLIEEFMIQANVAAAELLEAKKRVCLYRVHDAPSRAKFEGLREFLKSINISIASQSSLRPADFNGILRKAQGSPNEPLINEMVLRSQAQAEYAPENIGHFGLNLGRYAHFTSPIRRYADLLVHRALLAAYSLGTPEEAQEADLQALERLGDHLSGTERRAMLAERETTDRLIAAFLANQIGARFAGRITGVVGAGLFVRLNETGADGFVPVATLGADYFRYDDVQQSLIGAATGSTYQLGDEVDVRLTEAAPVAGALRFEMLTDGKAGKAAGHANKRGRTTPKRGKRSAEKPRNKSAASHARTKVRKARGR